MSTGAALVTVRGLSAAKISTHETAFMVHWYERFQSDDRYTGRRMDVDGCELFRSRGQADLGIVIGAARGLEAVVEPIVWSGVMAHDVLMCVGNTTESALREIMPPILLELTIDVSDDGSSLVVGRETPLDVVSIASQAFRGFEKVSRGGSFGHPFLGIVVSPKHANGLHAMIGAMNRIDNYLVHGPMLYEVVDDTKYVNLPVLYVGFFLVFVPSLISMANNIDIRIVLSAALCHWCTWFSLLPVVLILCLRLPADSAAIPYLLSVLSRVLTDPESSPKSVESLIALSVTPDWASPLLVYRYGLALLPVTLARIGMYNHIIIKNCCTLLRCRFHTIFEKKG